MVATQVACVIPARRKASRFPDKLLQSFRGEPIIRHTVKIALAANCFKQIYCFSDSKTILNCIADLKCHPILTGPALNGTERIAKNCHEIKSALVVNLQGDEPVFPPHLLQVLADALRRFPNRIHIVARPCEKNSPEWSNPNRVKVVSGVDDEAVNFFRVSNRHYNLQDTKIGIQLGAYAYPKTFLKKYIQYPASAAELKLPHELLRNLSLAKIKTHWTSESSISVDTPDDLLNLRNKFES